MMMRTRDKKIINNLQTPPKQYVCYITQEIMTNPVLLISSGYSYEKKALEIWLKKNNTDPKTDEPLVHKGFCPNRDLKALIDNWLEENRLAMRHSEEIKPVKSMPEKIPASQLRANQFWENGLRPGLRPGSRPGLKK